MMDLKSKRKRIGMDSFKFIILKQNTSATNWTLPESTAPSLAYRHFCLTIHNHFHVFIRTVWCETHSNPSKKSSGSEKEKKSGGQSPPEVLPPWLWFGLSFWELDDLCLDELLYRTVRSFVLWWSLWIKLWTLLISCHVFCCPLPNASVSCPFHLWYHPCL